MQIIARPRGGGKTTEAVDAVLRDEKLIYVTASREQALAAHKLACEISKRRGKPMPQRSRFLSVGEVQALTLDRNERWEKRYFIDELPMVLEQILKGQVHGATITPKLERGQALTNEGYAHPSIVHTTLPETIEGLARDIRVLDGNHDLGAAELAEALVKAGWRKHARIIPTISYVADPEGEQAQQRLYRPMNASRLQELLAIALQDKHLNADGTQPEWGTHTMVGYWCSTKGCPLGKKNLGEGLIPDTPMTDAVKRWLMTDAQSVDGGVRNVPTGLKDFDYVPEDAARLIRAQERWQQAQKIREAYADGLKEAVDIVQGIATRAVHATRINQTNIVLKTLKNRLAEEKRHVDTLALNEKAFREEQGKTITDYRPEFVNLDDELAVAAPTPEKKRARRLAKDRVPTMTQEVLRVRAEQDARSAREQRRRAAQGALQEEAGDAVQPAEGSTPPEHAYWLRTLAVRYVQATQYTQRRMLKALEIEWSGDPVADLTRVREQGKVEALSSQLTLKGQ